MALFSKVAKAAAAPRRSLFSNAAKIAKVAAAAAPRRSLFAKPPKAPPQPKAS